MTMWAIYAMQRTPARRHAGCERNFGECRNLFAKDLSLV